MGAGMIGALRINLEASDAKFSKDLNRARGKLRRFQQSAQSWAAGGAALSGLTAGLTGVATAAARASTALSGGMANVATLIPGTTSRVTELRDGVRDLSIAHGKDVQDLAAGLYQTISAFGDRAGQTMQILEIASQAATAGAATTSDAIALTSAVTKAYGDTSSAAVRKAADLALMTVRLGQTDFPPRRRAAGPLPPRTRRRPPS